MKPSILDDVPGLVQETIQHALRNITRISAEKEGYQRLLGGRPAYAQVAELTSDGRREGAAWRCGTWRSRRVCRWLLVFHYSRLGRILTRVMVRPSFLLPRLGGEVL